MVFTNGCGHVTYLQEARNLGKSLIIGVNSDASVKRQNKGDDRPINTVEDRMSILASLACVDAVIVFEEDTPLNLIQTITPQILAKGGDWKVDQIVGAKHVKKHGGQVHSIDFQFDRSTTNTLKKIRQSK